MEYYLDHHWNQTKRIRLRGEQQPIQCGRRNNNDHSSSFPVAFVRVTNKLIKGKDPARSTRVTSFGHTFTSPSPGSQIFTFLN